MSLLGSSENPACPHGTQYKEEHILSGTDQGQMHFFCPDSMCTVMPGFHKTEEKRNSYRVGTSKKNIGRDIISWRWCQFWTVKARPANVICPIPAEHTNSVVAKAWNSGFVHSITERKENESWLPISREGHPGQNQSLETVHKSFDLLSKPQFVVKPEEEIPARKRSEQ